MDSKNYYRVLKLEPGSSTSDVKKAYRKLSLKYHPDKVETNKTSITQNQQKKKEAYDILSNDLRKNLYDKEYPNDEQDYYNIFSMTKDNFSPGELRKQYRSLCAKNRIVLKTKEEDKKLDLFNFIKEAYNILIDENKKKLYDKYGDENFKETTQDIDIEEYNKKVSKSIKLKTNYSIKLKIEQIYLNDYTFNIKLNRICSMCSGLGVSSSDGISIFDPKIHTTEDKEKSRNGFIIDPNYNCSQCSGCGYIIQDIILSLIDIYTLGEKTLKKETNNDQPRKSEYHNIQILNEEYKVEFLFDDPKLLKTVHIGDGGNHIINLDYSKTERIGVDIIKSDLILDFYFNIYNGYYIDNNFNLTTVKEIELLNAIGSSFDSESEITLNYFDKQLKLKYPNETIQNNDVLTLPEYGLKLPFVNKNLNNKSINSSKHDLKIIFKVKLPTTIDKDKFLEIKKILGTTANLDNLLGNLSSFISALNSTDESVDFTKPNDNENSTNNNKKEIIYETLRK